MGDKKNCEGEREKRGEERVDGKFMREVVVGTFPSSPRIGSWATAARS